MPTSCLQREELMKWGQEKFNDCWGIWVSYIGLPPVVLQRCEIGMLETIFMLLTGVFQQTHTRWKASFTRIQQQLQALVAEQLKLRGSAPLETNKHTHTRGKDTFQSCLFVLLYTPSGMTIVQTFSSPMRNRYLLCCSNTPRELSLHPAVTAPVLPLGSMARTWLKCSLHFLFIQHWRTPFLRYQDRPVKFSIW